MTMSSIKLTSHGNADIIYQEASMLVDSAETKKSADRANDILTDAEYKCQEMDIADRNQTRVSKLNLRIFLLKCQLFGKKQEYELVVDAAITALKILDGIKDNLDYTDVSNVEATALGYKGFALMKMKYIDEATQSLSRSYELRTCAKKDVALVDGRKLGLKNNQSNRESLFVEKALAECCRLKGIEAPLPPLTKFSRTVHLFDAGGTAVSTDDLVLSKGDGLFAELADGSRHVIIEEKVDGANFGISLSADNQIMTQNRSHYVTSGDHVQFSPLAEWVEQHRDALTNILSHNNVKRTASQGLILFGEWVVARHSIAYDKLPGRFIAFDIYDRFHSRFLSRAQFHLAMRGSEIPVVPIIAIRSFGPYERTRLGQNDFEDELKRLLETPSQFRTNGGPVEGVILRLDEEVGGDSQPRWLERRLKIVRPDFVAGCADGHWRSRDIEKQLIDYEFATEYLSGCYQCAPESVNDNVEKLSLEESQTGTEAGNAIGKNPASKSPPVASSISSKSEKKASRLLKEQLAAKSRIRNKAPKYVMLMGLPAAGKSTFANTLASEWQKHNDERSATRGGNNKEDVFVVINQDKMGKKACIELAGKCAGRDRVLLDRCNATASERSEWMKILHCPPKSETVLIYFSSDAETCVDRAQKRVGHETIPEGRGERIVTDMSRRLEPPTAHETASMFGSIHTVHTFEDSKDILRRWGCS